MVTININKKNLYVMFIGIFLISCIGYVLAVWDNSKAMYHPGTDVKVNINGADYGLQEAITSNQIVGLSSGCVDGQSVVKLGGIWTCGAGSGVNMYDSGWVAVSGTASKTVAHGLGSTPRIVQVWISTKNDGTADIIAESANLWPYGVRIIKVDSTNVNLHSFTYPLYYFNSYPTGVVFDNGGYFRVIAIK